jgi:Na+/phosphate symporter
MSDTKILQVILDGQRAVKEELKGDIAKVGKDVSRVEKKVDDVRKEVVKNGKRIDKLGLDLADHSDDAPTIEEFDNLEKRVTNLEHSTIRT